jgi:tRNA1Val (adenine37-N6)-methyltransferase
MSSINQFPTFNYSQPEGYRFSHDSVFLARRVFEWMAQNQWNPQTALDLCSGCGVIGLDLLFHLRHQQRPLPTAIDFLEIQDLYRSHFEENLRRLGACESICRFVNENYNQDNSKFLKEKYDLIISNPPYFSTQQGRLPTSELKLRSRFFVDSDLATLIHFVHKKLSRDGRAFILIRDQTDHKVNQLESVCLLCQDKLNFEILEDIRGTHLILLSAPIEN